MTDTETRRHSNENLDRYAKTDADRAVFAALVETGGDFKAMAERLGLQISAMHSRLARLRKRAAAAGWSPNQDVTKPVAEGYHLKGTSSYYSLDEKTQQLKLTGQWVKTDKDREDRLEAMRIACDELAEPLKGIIPAVPAPVADLDDDLMAAYLIGDHHLGMYAWAEETGADYDCDIAERILMESVGMLAASAPAARKALIVSPGDFFHADNHSSRTPASGHQLDTDSRHSRVIQIGIRVWKWIIRLALEKHEVVEVSVVDGNHDPESSLWLAHCLASAFEGDPRVSVQLAPTAHRYVVWGDCLIGTTHGDKSKTGDLAEIMAVDRREQWGVARHCHWYTGHIHHKTVTALRGCTVESLCVLAPGDSWHVGQGYRSTRGMQLDVWHKRRGRVITLHGTVEYETSD